jgi:hypothetical protein
VELGFRVRCPAGTCFATIRDAISGRSNNFLHELYSLWLYRRTSEWRFWYRFYKGPKATLQWAPQYSYLVRNTWSGAAGPSLLGQPSGIENMFLTSFRYYLP